MPSSTRSTRPTAVVEAFDDPTLTPKPQPLPLPDWEAFPPVGPHDLYMAFATDAVNEFFLRYMEDLTDEQTGLIYEAVHLGVKVALAAAGVEMSWASSYQRATAHLR